MGSERPTTTLRPIRGNNVTLTKPPMLFFYRGCPKKDGLVPKPGCEGVRPVPHENNLTFKESCFCTTDLCNGESSSSAGKRNSVSVTTFTLECFFILSQIITPGFLFSITNKRLLLHGCENPLPGSHHLS